MTDPEPEGKQPEPVVNSAAIAGAVSTLVAAVGTVLVSTGWVTDAQVTAAGHWARIVVLAICAVITAFAPLVAAAHARTQVTPLKRPRDVRGQQLVPVDAYGRHAAAPARREREELGEAEHVAWAQNLNLPEEPVADDAVRRLPEQVISGRRLGRHVRHDPRSLSYLVPETATPTTAMWTRRVPVFDQGDLGSCTGNAAAGVLGTDPFYATLPAGLVDDEGEAVRLYSAATALDDYSGTYPPDDTGSDGLSVAKACQRAGLISGYTHITSVAAAQTAIKTGPFIVGTSWYSSMDEPEADGLVTVGGLVRGGHEYVCDGYDAENDLWWFTNSWGASWGKQGRFCMSSASFARLLAEQGDATVFLPAAAPFPPEPPAPTPDPDPQPAPVVSLPPDTVREWAERTLALKHETEYAHTGATDYLTWLASVSS